MSDINPKSLRGWRTASTYRSESMKITNTDNTKTSSDSRDLHPQLLLLLLLLFSGKKNIINILGKWGQGGAREHYMSIKEGERKTWELYSHAFWERALLSGLSGCQDEAKVHHWSATETADVEHLVFPLAHPTSLSVSVYLSLSLSASTHARSTWLSASTADLISLSLQCCYGNQHFGTTVPQSCNGSFNLILLQPEIPSRCRLQRALHTRWGP